FNRAHMLQRRLECGRPRLEACDFGLGAVHPKLDPRPGIDRDDIARGKHDGIEDGPHGHFLFFTLKMEVMSEATKAPIEPFDGLVIEGGREARGAGAAWVIAGGSAIDDISPSKLTVRSSLMTASRRPAHPGWLSMAEAS